MIDVPEKIKHHSAFRSHPLTEERKAAERAVRTGVDSRVIIDVDGNGNPVYAMVDVQVEKAMEFPVRSRTRPRARLGSR